MRKILQCSGMGESTFVSGEFCLQNTVYFFNKDLGVKSRRKFVYMKGQHNGEFGIFDVSICMYTHFSLNLGH